jgi:hypothetical protein
MRKLMSIVMLASVLTLLGGTTAVGDPGGGSIYVASSGYRIN